MDENFKAAIARIRRSVWPTQDIAASETGIHRSAWAQYESGERLPGRRAFQQLVAVLPEGERAALVTVWRAERDEADRQALGGAA